MPDISINSLSTRWQSGALALRTLSLIAALLLLPVTANAQTPAQPPAPFDSSLYLNPDQNAAAASARFGQPPVIPGFTPKINPHIGAMSLAVVTQPEPTLYRVNDLITIIVRESFESSSDQQLDTEKEVNVEGEISEFPRLTLSDLADFQLVPNTFPNGRPALGVDFSNEFEGSGSASRRDTMTGRITARVIDVKPNGTLVLEARKFTQNNKESVSIIATGMCRAVDVSPADNTILSSDLYDLHIVQNSEGELKKATRKGLLTRILDGLFAF
ncbi:MAG: flagellar basal body L-ring protein FlgH [Planctomycetota bacterium]